MLEEKKIGKVTLVTYSDLLGFGGMVANANGTLDSAVGRVALKRIELLKQALDLNAKLFPINAKFFHLNDLVLATLDIDLEIDSMQVDPQSIFSQPISRKSWVLFLDFLSASGSLHQEIIKSENSNQIGPGGRTFVVLGRRWDLQDKSLTHNVIEIPEFQGNMALAEAYQADSLGSKAGFDGNPWDRFYINDFAWFALSAGTAPLAPQFGQIKNEERILLNNLGNKTKAFPENLVRLSTIEVTIFHRKRTFHPLMSHHVCDISNCLLKS